MAEHPKVFISYSHDTPEHKQWVSELGAKLRHNGVDTILNQWDLGLGDDLTLFMERGIRDSDRVLVICTDSYVSKANAGKGGVGYERLIVTAQLVQDLGTDKFIPIIRQASGEEKTPTFLGTRVYIDFRNDSQFESEFNKLLHQLHRVPVVEKPTLRKSPFAQLRSGQEASPSEGLDTQLPEIPNRVESAADAYSTAGQIAGAGDMFRWRQLVKRIRSNAFNSLVQRRQEGLAGETPTGKEKIKTVDEAVGIISPVISVALAGVESKMEQFRDQKSTLEDLLNTVGRRAAGPVVWGDIAFALGYVYHSLHGGISLITNQLDLALSLARVKIFDLYAKKRLHVWKKHDLMGWSASLGDDCTKSWQYLSTAYEKWEWLAPIFGDELEYRTSLVAYYMALSIHELASRIASDQPDPFSTFNKVPLTFLSEDYSITQQAITMIRNQKEPTQLWTCLNVTREQMESSWRHWIRAHEERLWGGNERQRNLIARHDLIDIFRNFFEGL
jgi:hypothetical protein